MTTVSVRLLEVLIDRISDDVASMELASHLRIRGRRMPTQDEILRKKYQLTQLARTYEEVMRSRNEE